MFYGVVVNGKPYVRTQRGNLLALELAIAINCVVKKYETKVS